MLQVLISRCHLPAMSHQPVEQVNINKTSKIVFPVNAKKLSKISRARQACTSAKSHHTQNIEHVNVQIQRGGQEARTPLKNHKSIGVSSDTGPDPQKNRSYQARIQCWAIIGTLAKRHLMAFHWQADDGPLKTALESFLPSSKKKKKHKPSKHVESDEGYDSDFFRDSNHMYLYHMTNSANRNSSPNHEALSTWPASKYTNSNSIL